MLWTALGVALIALTLRDIFAMLFHSLGRGRIGRLIIRGVSTLCARIFAATLRDRLEVPGETTQATLEHYHDHSRNRPGKLEWGSRDG